MNLYLVQHGEAKRKEEDPDRPLTEEGRSDVHKVGDFVAEHAEVHPSRIWHSGKTRAKQTAEVMADCLEPRSGVEEAEGLEPLADPSIWEEKLTWTGEDVMLVGHLPHLSKLASLLLCGDEEAKILDFQMGGVVCLGRDEEGVWSVRWMVVPGMVG